MEEEGLSDASYSSGDEEVADAASPRKVNPSGKPPEAGIIVKVYVENFMCHKKMSIPLCHNVNFIHGQNGSGKVSVRDWLGRDGWDSMVVVCSGDEITHNLVSL